MENKKIIYTMFNSKNEEEEVVFEARPLVSRWKFTEKVSEAAKIANGDEFKLTFEIAKRLFPEMMVKPEFPRNKVVEGKTWSIDDQIREFFENDPQTLTRLVRELMGLMTPPRKTTEE